MRYKEVELKAGRWSSQKVFKTLLNDFKFTKVVFAGEMSVSTSALNGYKWTYDQRLIAEAPQSKTGRVNCFGAVGVPVGEIIETVRKSARTSHSYYFLTR